MKKIIILCFTICTLFITGCGCSKKEEKIVVKKCSNKAEEDNYTYNVDYDLESNENNMLLKYTRTEIYTSDDNAFLDNMEQYKNDYFSELQKLESVEYNSEIVDNQLKTTLIIDFSNNNDNKKIFELDPFYLNFYNDETELVDINYAVDYYVGENMTCS